MSDKGLFNKDLFNKEAIDIDLIKNELKSAEILEKKADDQLMTDLSQPLRERILQADIRMSNYASSDHDDEQEAPHKTAELTMATAKIHVGRVSGKKLWLLEQKRPDQKGGVASSGKKNINAQKASSEKKHTTEVRAHNWKSGAVAITNSGEKLMEEILDNTRAIMQEQNSEAIYKALPFLNWEQEQAELTEDAPTNSRQFNIKHRKQLIIDKKKQRFAELSKKVSNTEMNAQATDGNNDTEEGVYLGVDFFDIVNNIRKKKIDEEKGVELLKNINSIKEGIKDGVEGAFFNESGNNGTEKSN